MRVSLRGTAVVCALGACLLAATPESARAAGIEDTVTGTHALGRGAYYARVRDFMAVWQNPANLALMPKSHIGMNLRVPMFDGCFTRQKDPNQTYYPDDGEPFQKICNHAGILPSGSGGWAWKLTDDFAVAGGAFVPAGVAKLDFGSDTIYTKAPVNDQNRGAQQLPTTDPGPGTPPTSPGRFNLMSRTTIAAFFMSGMGYAPMPQFRVGLSAGFGFAVVHYKSVASLFPGESQQETEFLNKLRVVDGFIPRVTASVGSTPIPGLDLSGIVTWTDDIRARGEQDLNANGFQDAELGNCRSQINDEGDGLSGPGARCRVSDVRLRVPYQRFQVMLAARYAMLRKGRTKSSDPMRDEYFDLEVNAYWEQTSHVDSFDLRIYDPASGGTVPRVNANTAPSGVRPSEVPTRANIDHSWRDTYGVRVGGDYNVLRNLLAVRAGVGYETQGVPDSHMALDFWPVQKVVLHLGATVRLGDIDLHVAYAHSFNWDVTTALGEGEVRQVTAFNEDNLPGAGQPPAVNEGKYTSDLDVVAFGATYNF